MNSNKNEYNIISNQQWATLGLIEVEGARIGYSILLIWDSWASPTKSCEVEKVEK